MNYSYIIYPIYCKGTLRNFYRIKDYFLFSPLCAKTHQPILVPIEYLQGVEGGATKCMYELGGVSTGTEWWTSWQRESRNQRKNRSSTISWRCNPIAPLTCTPEHSPPVSHETKNFWNSSGTPITGPLTTTSNSRCRPQPYNFGLKIPQKLSN